MHSTYARQRAHYPSYGDVVVYSLDDDLREPGLVPSPQDEGADELIFHCSSHTVSSAGLSQSACGHIQSNIRTLELKAQV